MSITRNFDLYLTAGKSIPLVINVSQYDQGETWVFTLYKEDGTQYVPSTGAIVGIKSDGYIIANAGTVDEQGRVVITETQQMTAAAGKAIFELQIDNDTHGTANFIVLVEPSPSDDGTVSDSDLSLLQEALDATSPLPTGGTVGQVLTKTANGSTWSDAGTPTQEQVASAVSDWADEHITVETGVVIDTSLAVAGAAADAKKVGDEITDLKSALNYSCERFGKATTNNVLTDITADFQLSNGYIDNRNGNFVASDIARSTDYLSVYEYGDLYVTGAPSYSSNCLYALYDTNKNFLDYHKDSTFEEDYHFYLNDIITSYPKAVYVRFSSILNQGGLKIKRPANMQDLVNRAYEWLGKKWVCVGDSLTENNSRTTIHYFDYISEKTGITTVNMGLSGSGYKHATNSGTGAFYQRIVNVPTDADVVTIFGSGNDLTHGYTLGNPTDTGTETICGCINTTIDTLIGIMPAVQLGIVAPTPWVNFPPTTADNAMDQYVEALKTICESRSIPFLDLYHCSNLRPWTAEGRAACYSKDDGNGVHPDETGHKLIAPRFKGFLDFLLV